MIKKIKYFISFSLIRLKLDLSCGGIKKKILGYWSVNVVYCVCCKVLNCVLLKKDEYNLIRYYC